MEFFAHCVRVKEGGGVSEGVRVGGGVSEGVRVGGGVERSEGRCDLQLILADRH